MCLIALYTLYIKYCRQSFDPFDYGDQCVKYSQKLTTVPKLIEAGSLYKLCRLL